MEHVLHAARAGRVAKLAVKEGQQVTQGALIAALADVVVIPGLTRHRSSPGANGARLGSRDVTRFPDDDAPTARSPDWMRLTPAFSMLFQAAASEPCVSMPRQASSMT